MTSPAAPAFSIKPTLTGEKVVLRPFATADFPVLLAALADPEVLRLTGSVHSAQAEAGSDDTERFLEFYRVRNAQPDRLDLAVVDRASGECGGEVVLNEWDNGNRSCNFRTLIGRPGPRAGHGGPAPDCRLRFRAARPAPDLAGGLRVQPACPARLREGRLRRRGRAARGAPLRGRVDRRDRHVHPRPRMGPPPGLPEASTG